MSDQFQLLSLDELKTQAEIFKNALMHYASLDGDPGAYARAILDGEDLLKNSPYRYKYIKQPLHNPNYDQDAMCICGHVYYRHFDPYENNEACGCKYCTCAIFKCESDYKSLKLFLDDEREPPNDGCDWLIVRNIREAVHVLTMHWNKIDFISFDHDLGLGDSVDGFENTGMGVARWIIEQCLDDKFTLHDNFSWYVHSQNPVGAENINSLLTNFVNNMR